MSKPRPSTNLIIETNRLAKTLLVDEVVETDYRAAGWQHPERPLHYRIIAPAPRSNMRPGWALLDTSAELPRVLDAGSMTPESARLHVDTATNVGPRRLAARRMLEWVGVHG